jgi:hypothetical protein
MASTDSKLTKLQFVPGFHKESTRYGEEGKWFEGDRVRFRQGKPENLRGYKKHNTTALTGVARDILAWNDNDTRKHIIIGTNKEVIVEKDATFYDVTPIVTVVSAQDIFNTTQNSKTVVVSINNHDLTIGDRIIVEGATTVGGNIDLSSGTGIHVITSVVGLNSFEIESSISASETSAGAGGTAVSVAFLLRNELSDAIQGLGWGAGVYNAGASTTGVRAWNQPSSASNITFRSNQWSFDNYEEYVLGVRRGGQILAFQQDASVTPERMKVVTSSTNAVHITATEAPVRSNFLLVSPNDGHVICFGTNSIDGTFDPLLVRWSDQEDFSNWAVSAGTTSRENPLADGTEIVGAVRSRGEILIWTDNSLHNMVFTGDRASVFRFTQLGTKCGLIGPHAAIDYDGISYWMGENNFYAYDGRVQNLPCTIRRHLFDDFNNTNKDKVYAGINSEFKEIIWLYPKGNSTEPNAYVIYNTEEKTWVFGDSFYTTYKDRQVFDNTIATGQRTNFQGVTDSSQFVFDNEPEEYYTDDEGNSLTSFIKSSNFDVGDGDDIMYINRIIPDYKLDDGQNINIFVNVKEFPNSSEETVKGPFVINSAVTKIDMRARGRQASVKVSATNDGSWRWGTVRMALQNDGKR